MSNKEFMEKILRGEDTNLGDIYFADKSGIRVDGEGNELENSIKSLFKEVFGYNGEINVVNLEKPLKSTKEKAKGFYVNSGIENLLEAITKAHTEQDNTEETNKITNDEYFFKELETAKKAILEAKTLDKKTILFSKERERLQGAILEYCHKKDWSSTIKFTLSKEIVTTNLKDEFLKSVCKEFGLKLLDNKTRSLQDVEFELKTN